jgi:hypothetical protein
MEAIERSYDEIRAALERRGGEPADAAAMKALERMSSERLWYRVGGRMAAVIDTRLGRAALVGLVEKGPAAFRAEYRRLQAQAWAPGRREGGPPRTEQVDAAR